MQDTDNEASESAIVKSSTPGTRRDIFCQMVRSYREQTGISVAELANTTRISRTFIEGFESGSFAVLPSTVFARGFLKSIAKALGADPKPLLAAFDAANADIAATEALNVPLATRDMESGLRRSNDLMGLKTLTRAVTPQFAIGFGLVIAFGIVGSLTVRWMGSSPDATPGDQVAETVVHPQSQEAAGSEAGTVSDPLMQKGSQSGPQNGPQIGSLPSTLNNGVADQPSIAVAVDHSSTAAKVDLKAVVGSGEQVIEITVKSPVRLKVKLDNSPTERLELLPKQYVYRFKDKAELMIYDAAAVEMTYNGRALGGLGSKGRIRKLSFVADEKQPKIL